MANTSIYTINQKYIQTVFVLLLPFITSFKSPSCTCAGLTGIEDANHVFIGTVTSISKSEEFRTIKFEVLKPLKGLSKNKETFTIKNGLSNCSFRFVENQTYAVYAEKYQKRKIASNCSMTEEISKSEIDNYKVKSSTEVNIWK